MFSYYFFDGSAIFLSNLGSPFESNKSDYCYVTLRNFLVWLGSRGGAGNGLLNIYDDDCSSNIFSSDEFWFAWISTVGDLSLGVLLGSESKELSPDLD